MSAYLHVTHLGGNFEEIQGWDFYASDAEVKVAIFQRNLIENTSTELAENVPRILFEPFLKNSTLFSTSPTGNMPRICVASVPSKILHSISVAFLPPTLDWNFMLARKGYAPFGGTSFFVRLRRFFSFCFLFDFHKHIAARSLSMNLTIDFKFQYVGLLRATRLR